MDKKTDNYDTKYQELEQIIDKLQSSELGLDDAVLNYERGIKLIAELEKYLKEAENKVTQIKAKLK